MERKIWSLLLSFMVILATSSCDKEDENPAKTKTDMLTGTTWQITAYTVNPPLNFGGTLISDLYAQFNCYSDNTLVFDKNGTVKQDAGVLKCFDGEPATIQGNWVFNTTETVITTTATGYDPLSYDVVELTEDIFKCTVKETDDQGVVYTFSYTYTKK